MNLKGKVVVVTGASHGIGAEAARKLAQQGAHVVLAARTLSMLEHNVATIRSEGGVAEAVQLDVTSDSSVRRAVSEILERFGCIDVLINNAGNGGSLAFFVDTDPAIMRALFDVHVFGAERMTRAVLPSMLARGAHGAAHGKGRVVNVISTVAYVPMPGAAAYSAAKAAVVAHTEALRGELADTGVELVLFAPPHTQTEAGKAWPLDLPKQFSPEYAAQSLVNTLTEDRRTWLAGGNASLLWLQRISPRWAARIMRDIGLDATRKVSAQTQPASLV